MNNFVVFKQPRLLIDQYILPQNTLTLKIGLNKQIYRFPGFTWNKHCLRWERKEEIKVNLEFHEIMEFQVLQQRKSSKVAQVLGQGFIAMSVIFANPAEQIKVALSYNGIIIGWLYFEIRLNNQQNPQKQGQYLYVHKINLSFLEQRQSQMGLTIYKNDESIYQKQFTLVQKSKNFFPALKLRIKISDVLIFQFHASDGYIKPLRLMIDHIKRGKTSLFEAWIRNMIRNKIGDLTMEYFLQNLYLQNQRKMFKQNAIIPQKMPRIVQSIPEEKQNKKFQRIDRKILSINSKLDKMLLQVKLNDKAMPCLRKSRKKTRLLKKESNQEKPLATKQKISFYFNGPQL